MALLHAIIQHYYVDGQDGVLTPVGMLGNKLEADYHIVHGIRTRVQNTIRCIKEIPLEVEDVVLNSLASSQVVVSQNQKNLGVVGRGYGPVAPSITWCTSMARSNRAG